MTTYITIWQHGQILGIKYILLSPCWWLEINVIRRKNIGQRMCYSFRKCPLLLWQGTDSFWFSECPIFQIMKSKFKETDSERRTTFSTSVLLYFRIVSVLFMSSVFRERLSWKQYVKTKRYRLGIKLYLLCDCERMQHLCVSSFKQKFYREELFTKYVCVANAQIEEN